MLRTLLSVPIVVLMLTGAACTKPSYGKASDDAGQQGVDGPRPDADSGGAPAIGAPPGPAQSAPDAGGKDAGEPSVSPQPDAAMQTACIVGLSRIGECKLH